MTYAEYLRRHSRLSEIIGRADSLAGALQQLGYEIAADDVRTILVDLKRDRAALDRKWAREKEQVSGS